MEGWQQGPLVSFAELISTGPFGSMLHKSDYTSEGVPLINPINIVDGTIVPDREKQLGVSAVTRLSSFVLKTGDVIVGRRGEIGRCAVVGANEDGWVCGTGCFFIRPRSSMNPQFLANLLRSPFYRGKLERASTGATMSNLSNASLAGLPVAVPPLSEQRRIVAILDEAFEAIATAKANTEKNLQNARELFRRHLEQVFLRYGDSSPSRPLEALTESDSPITYGVVKPGNEGDVAFVRGGDIVQGRVLMEQLRTIDAAVSRQYRRTLLKGGELLISLVGQPGQVAVAPPELKGANIARQVGLIRLNAQVDAEYVRFYLQSPAGQAALGARQSGSVQQVINLGELRNVMVPIPSLALQRDTVRALESFTFCVERLTELAESKLAALTELKTSLLHQAFAGKLTAKSTDQQVAKVA